MIKNDTDERTRAREKALVLLTDMDRTEQELINKLHKRGFSEEAIKDALEYVRSYGYVNDERYARRYVELFSSKRSRKRIEYDLYSKGVSKELISQAVEELLDQDAQEDLIQSLAAKKMRSLDPSDPSARRKLISFLSGKGFSTELVLRTVSDLLKPSEW